MYEPATGATSAAKYTQPAARDVTAGNPNSELAAGPSVATMTARDDTVWPVAVVTRPGCTFVAAQLRCTLPEGRPAASWLVISPMPLAGTPVSPVASVRKMMSNMRRDVPRAGSSCMPPTRGRKKRSMIAEEKPNARSAVAVGTSSPRNNIFGSRRTSFIRKRAMRALSRTDPMGAVAVSTTVFGRRSGSPTT